MGFIVFLIVGGFIVYFVIQKGKANQEKWREAAAQLGLGYYPGGLGTLGKIHGIKGGHRVEVSTYSRSHNNNTSTYTKYIIRYASPILTDFKIVRQNKLHKVGVFLGLQDVEVGDPAFDDRALVRGTNPQRIIEFLTPDRRKAIQRLLDSYIDVEITQHHIELNKSGKDLEPAVIYHTGRTMLSVANELTDTTHTLAEEDHVIEMNEAPSATPILSVTNPAEEKPDPYFPENPFEKKSAGVDFVETWGEENETEVDQEYIEPVEPAFDAFTSANPVVPDPACVESEPILEEQEVAATDAEPVEEEPDEPAEDPVAASDSISLEMLAADLYSGDSSAMLKVDSEFEEKYAGKRISGEGELDRLSRFSYDSIFTGREGVKAFFKICEIQGAYTKVRVVAEVAYPSGQYDELRSQVGTILPIAGIIIAQNKSLYRLYIEHD